MSLDEMDFEQELKNALARKEPAKGFAERVIRQVEPLKPAHRPNRAPVMKLRRWAPLAVAASLMCGVFGVVRYEEYRKAQHAKDQLMLALRITAHTIGTVERKLRE
jgi:hypothetical protein